MMRRHRKKELFSCFGERGDQYHFQIDMNNKVRPPCLLVLHFFKLLLIATTLCITVSTRLFQDLPVRVVSIHQCFDDTPVMQMFRAVNALMLKGAKQKIRLLTHLGDNWEVRYKLLSYGIPVDCKWALQSCYFFFDLLT